MTRRFILATNIPTPYRVAFFAVLAEELRQRDISFEVFYYAPSEPNRRWQIALEDQPYRWRILPGVHPAFRGIYPHLNPGLPVAIRRARPTWLLVAGAWNTPSSVLALSRVLSGAGVRLFWSEGHAQAVLHPRGAIAAARRFVLGQYDGFVVPNQASEQFVCQEIKRPLKCLRLPNTVDEEFYLAGPGVPRGQLRRDLGLRDEDVVILCVAQLNDRKGVLDLAQAVGDLPDLQRRRAVLAFVGDGPLRDQLANAAGGVPVRLVGHVGADRVRAWMYAADIFVLPSKVDPNPLSAIEAAFCGTPLVLSARAGNAQDLLRGGGGWSIPAPDRAAITTVLSEVMAAPEDVRRSAGARAREVAISEFSRKGAAVRFIDQLLLTFPAPAHAPSVSYPGAAAE